MGKTPEFPMQGAPPEFFTLGQEPPVKGWGVYGGQVPPPPPHPPPPTHTHAHHSGPLTGLTLLAHMHTRAHTHMHTCPPPFDYLYDAYT